MSQENVEIVRATFEARNAGDMDAFRELYDPDVIARAPEGWPEPGPFVGRERLMRQWGRSARPGTPIPWNRSATSSTLAIELP
jgi:ketosteroid isomerase-like protein